MKNMRFSNLFKLKKKKKDPRGIEFQKAFDAIKTLKGLVHICSHCRMIKDETGLWSLLEVYIQENSNMSFSHGICQTCSDELYGKEDWYTEMKEKESIKQ